MHRGDTAPSSTEDALADEAVARGRNAGGPWIIAAVLVFGAGLVARSGTTFALAWSAGLALFLVGVSRRARYWRSVRRRLGDATIQRARWRSVEADGSGSGRIALAALVVLLLLGLEVWWK